MKRSPIKRKTPLKRGGKLKPASTKRAAQLRKYSVLNAKFLAEYPFCQAGIVAAKCGAWSSETHHKAGRNGVRLLDFSKCIAVCRPCHRWIESHRTQAEAFGLTLPEK